MSVGDEEKKKELNKWVKNPDKLEKPTKEEMDICTDEILEGIDHFNN